MSEKSSSVGVVVVSVVLSTLLSFGAVMAYFNYYLRPWDVVTVDFKGLSDASLIALVKRTTAGKPATKEDLMAFYDQFQALIDEEAQGRLVFESGTVINPVRDITEIVAKRMNLDLTQRLTSVTDVNSTLLRQLSGGGEKKPDGTPAQPSGFPNEQK